MNIFIFWSIVGLIGFATVHGAEKHESKHQNQLHHTGEHSKKLNYKAELTTAAPPVNTSKVLSNYDGLNIVYNYDLKLIGFVNVTENIALAFYMSNGGVAKFLVDSKTGTVLHFQHFSDISLLHNKNFTGDILNVLKIVISQYPDVAGTCSQIEPNSEEGLSLLSEVYNHLGHRVDKGDRNGRTLKYMVRWSKMLYHVFLGTLNGLLKGSGHLPLKQNLNRFVTITNGLSQLFSKAVGGLKAILKKGVTFDVNQLYNGRNGAEVLVYILRQTGNKFNLATLWGSLLNNIEELLGIIQLLGGGESKNGVDETFGIVSSIWAALNFNLPLTTLVKYLFDATSDESWSTADDGDFSQVLKDLKNITDEQSKKYDNSGLLTPFVQFSTNFSTNSLIHNGVNISELVEKWRKRDVIGGCKFVADVLLKFENPQLYNQLLFNGFIAFLNSSSDPEALKRLFPSGSINQLIGQGGLGNGRSLWDSLSKSFNIDSQLKNIGNPNEVFKNVPLFSNFSNICRNSSGIPFNFTSILNGSTISEYLSKQLLISPVKWSSDILHESGGLLQHIFWDPIKHFIPGASNGSQIFPFPTIPTILATRPVDQKDVKPASRKPCEDEDKCEPTTTKKKCEDDCDDEPGPTTSKPCEDDCDKDSESTSKKEVTTTEKHCKDDCGEKETTSPKEINPTDASEFKNPEPIEYKHHHQRKHHDYKKHHEKKHNVKNHAREHHNLKKHVGRKNSHHEEKDHLKKRHNFGQEHENKKGEKLHDRRHKEEKIH